LDSSRLSSLSQKMSRLALSALLEHVKNQKRPHFSGSR
jgi:hypothetical protein